MISDNQYTDFAQRHTGNEQSITITDSERMSDAEIAAAKTDAERYAAEDAARRDAIEKANEAQAVANEASELLRQRGKELDKPLRHDLKAALSEANRYLAKKPTKVTDADRAKLTEATARLRELMARA